MSHGQGDAGPFAVGVRGGDIVVSTEQRTRKLNLDETKKLIEQLTEAMATVKNKHTRLFIERLGDSLVLHLPEAGGDYPIAFHQAEATAEEILDVVVHTRGRDVTLTLGGRPLVTDAGTAIRIAELLLEHCHAWSADVDAAHRGLLDGQ